MKISEERIINVNFDFNINAVWDINQVCLDKSVNTEVLKSII